MAIVWRAARFFVFGIAAAAAVLFWSPLLAEYPGGVRDLDEWYYCYSSQYQRGVNGLTGVDWSDPICEQILWYEDTVSSQMMTGGVGVLGFEDSPRQEVARVRGFVMPAAGVESFTYRCNVVVSHCRPLDPVFAGSRQGEVRSGVGVWYRSDGTSWDLQEPDTDLGFCMEDTLNVVGTFRSAVYDRWATSQVIENWDEDGSNDGVYFDASWVTINQSHFGESSFACEILDWQMWDQHEDEWFPDDNDWIIPDYRVPTPVAWVPAEPWQPVTDTDPIEFGFTPGTTECLQFLPGFDRGATVFSYTLSVDIEPYEVCLEQYDFDLEFMGWDFGGFMLAIGLIGSFGVLYGLIKRGG